MPRLMIIRVLFALSLLLEAPAWAANPMSYFALQVQHGLNTANLDIAS